MSVSGHIYGHSQKCPATLHAAVKFCILGGKNAAENV